MMLRPFASLAAALLMAASLLPGPALASEGKLLVDEIPATLPPEAVIGVARQALLGRSWQVLKETPGSVEASLQQRGVSSTITIELQARSLFYRDRTRQFMTFGDMGGAAVDAPMPEHWLDFLRADIRAGLAQLALTRKTAQEACAADDAAARLRRLQQLRDEQLLSPAEYEAKRAEILKAL